MTKERGNKINALILPFACAIGQGFYGWKSKVENFWKNLPLEKIDALVLHLYGDDDSFFGRALERTSAIS